MKKVSALALSMVFAAALSFAAVNTYQVTGPVLEVKPDSITVQKGKDKWQIARDASTKITGDVKVGSKVTIEYRMSATSITVKEEGKAKASKKK
jgi:hypothetical protein